MSEPLPPASTTTHRVARTTRRRWLTMLPGYTMLGALTPRSGAQDDAAAPGSTALRKHSFTHPAMGSVFRIDLYAVDEAGAAAAAAATFAEVERLNQIASDYLPESELSRLNLAPAHQPVKVSEDLCALIAEALNCSSLTEGAFDITAAYAVQQWRRARRQKRLPTPAQTAQAREMTDWHQLKLDVPGRTVTKLKEGLKLDLGGIGKGYAADRALAVLREHGVTQAVVAGSGDLAIGGAPPGQKGWDVALRTFEKPDAGDVMMRLWLADRGCSTSGDLHQHLELDGTRYSHIIDPRTALGLTARIACTVLAPTSARSDALATAFCVLGVKKGLKLARSLPGVDARFSTVNERGLIEYTETAGFAQLRRDR